MVPPRRAAPAATAAPSGVVVVARYFAYGSNLDVVQMSARCPASVVVGPAILHDHALVFGGHSQRWAGAVASLVDRPGSRVPGVLYDLTADDLRALDGFEGHPHAYRREPRRVRCPGDDEARVQTYVQPRERFVPGAPSDAYVGVIVAAYERWGFALGELRVASGRGGGR